jgi:hypothetical protein
MPVLSLKFSQQYNRPFKLKVYIAGAEKIELANTTTKHIDLLMPHQLHAGK